jgi:hypothetical protein
VAVVLKRCRLWLSCTGSCGFSENSKWSTAPASGVRAQIATLVLAFYYCIPRMRIDENPLFCLRCRGHPPREDHVLFSLWKPCQHIMHILNRNLPHPELDRVS